MMKILNFVSYIALALGISTQAIGKSPASIFVVGQAALGGIVFYVDSTHTHGLVAAAGDVLSKFNWDGGITNFPTNALNNGIGAGLTNTSLIVSEISLYGQTLSSSSLNFAALACVKYCVEADNKTVCSNVSTLGYSNWYLPSLDELNLMWQESALFGLKLNGPYWSSTENGTNTAYSQSSTTARSISAKTSNFGVRCVRKF